MIWLKGCPRCGGDLVQESDTYGPYASCIQCGAQLELVPAVSPSGGVAEPAIELQTRV